VGNEKLASAVWSLEQCCDLPYYLSLGIGPNGVAKNRLKALKRIPDEVRHILMADDDIIASPHWASRMVSLLRNQDRIGAVSAVMMGPRGERQNGLHPELIGPGDLIDALIPGTFVMYDRLKCDIQWDTNYQGSQWEDTDGIVQVRKAGYRTVATGSVQIMHKNSALAKGKPKFWDENRAYFLSKWGEEVLK
jgi:GT2 family glycosyltransferase